MRGRSRGGRRRRAERGESVLVPLSTLLRDYVRHVRLFPLPELLAGAGIAAGVALVFSISVANSSITSSAREILATISGDAQMQLAARAPGGVDERTVQRIRAVPGVDVAAPLLEQRATLTANGRRVAVDLVGVDEQLGELGGLASSPLTWGLLRLPGAFLPEAVTDASGLAVDAGDQVTLEVRGHTRPVAVTAVLGTGVIGPLAHAMLAGAGLQQAQAWTGMRDRVTRIIVHARPGREAAVRAAVEKIGDDVGMEVSTLDDETARLEAATAPNDQATSLVAAIGVLVGLLLAFTAVLLTLPERRQRVAQLRLQGWSRGHLAQSVLAPALILGVVASAVGLVVGDVLSRLAAHNPPGYLAFAFPLGVQRTVSTTTILIAGLAGVLVSLLAAALPLLDLRSQDLGATVLRGGRPGHTITARTRWRLAAAAAATVAISTLGALLAPGTTVIAVALLAAATLLALPAIFWLLLQAIVHVPRRDRPSLSLEAAQALRATTLRALAVAATAAIAVFGALAIQGARSNLLTGLFTSYGEYVDGTDIWITQHGDDLALQPFEIDPERLAAIDGVARVRSYQGGLTDLGDRRVWMVARSPQDATPIPPSQVLAGNAVDAARQVRGGGAITVSQHIADEHGVDVGDRLTLQTPTGPRGWTVAAVTTNLGWGPGAIVMNLDDYQRAWASRTPTALELDVTPGHDVAQVIERVRAALGDDAPAVRVQTVAQRSAHARALAREGLDRLSQIAMLLVIAAGIAIAAAMTATIWQRRTTFAQRRLEGMRSPTLWCIVLLEAAITIAAGCIAGVLAGSYGHWLLGRWLQRSTGYPAPFDPEPLQLLATCGAVIVVALLVVAVPGYLAARAPTRLAFDPDP